jgi:hypothetical protein
VWAWSHLPKSIWKVVHFHMDFVWYWLDMVVKIMAYLKYLSLVFFNDILTRWAWIHLPKSIWKVVHFHMDFVWYWLDMAVKIMAYLKNLTLVFLWYFDHLKIIPCVSMESFTKTHMKVVHFHMDFVWYWLDMIVKIMAYLKYLTLVFFMIFGPFKNYTMCEHDSFTKSIWKVVHFHMDFVCYLLDMVVKIMAYLKYISYFSILFMIFWPFKYDSMHEHGII